MLINPRNQKLKTKKSLRDEKKLVVQKNTKEGSVAICRENQRLVKHSCLLLEKALIGKRLFDQQGNTKKIKQEGHPLHLYALSLNNMIPIPTLPEAVAILANNEEFKVFLSFLEDEREVFIANLRQAENPNEVMKLAGSISTLDEILQFVSMSSSK